MGKLVVACCLAGLGAAAGELPPPLIWWKMDEAQNGVVRDASGNGHDLTLGSGVTLAESDLYGKAAVTDASTNSWACASTPSFQDLTVTFWYYRAASDCDGVSVTEDENKFPYLIGGMGNVSMLFFPKSNQIRFLTGNAGLIEDYVFLTAQERGKWAHYAFTVSKTGEDSQDGKALYSIAYYLNAKLQFSTNGFKPHATIGLARDSTYFFNNGAYAKRPVGCRMDEFRMYGTALDLAGVAAEFRRPFETNSTRLLKHWSFDAIGNDGGTPIARESTGHGPDLTVGTHVSRSGRI